MKKLPVFFTLFIAVLSTAINGYAQKNQNKIPAWLASSETYGINVPLEAAYGTSWAFITHVPHTKEFLQDARRKGIRAFPYVTFYQAPLAQRYMGLRLSDHPDWILINDKGEWAPTGFWESEDSKNWYCTCPNVQEYTDAVLSYVEMLMKRGASGVFLDNVHPNRSCSGEKFGVHKHMYDTQIEAFANLLRRAREIIKKYDPEGALLINSADPATLPAEFWPYVDAEMSESFITTWVSEDRWGDWYKNWNGIDKKIPAGKQVCCLSYLGHDIYHSFKEDAFFCYASARLMNLIWGAGYNKSQVKDDSPVRLLYSLKLGPPATDEKVSDGVHYRVFKNGIVVVNPVNEKKGLTVDYDMPTKSLWDAFDDRVLQVENGKAVLKLPPGSGRVYMFKTSGDNGIERGGHILVVKTDPGLGKTHFELDGLPMVTYSGRWTTKYVKGPNYGSFIARFDTPGWHEVTIVDDTRAQILVANSYEDAYAINATKMPGATADDAGRRNPDRLGKLMDPSEPGKMYEGKPFKFVNWYGPVVSKKKTIKVYVDGEVTVYAKFEKTE